MKKKQVLSKKLLATIASQVGNLLSDTARRALAKGGKVELAESFPVWFLPPVSSTISQESLDSIAMRTGRWHHQIRHSGIAKEYARSRPYGPAPADWQVLSVVRSQISRKIDETMVWLDTNAPRIDHVRLLTVPSHHLTAFWFRTGGEEAIVVADKPRHTQRIRRNRIYTPKQFLSLIQVPPRRHCVAHRSLETSLSVERSGI
jgi:hypothetical protein